MVCSLVMWGILFTGFMLTSSGSMGRVMFHVTILVVECGISIGFPIVFRGLYKELERMLAPAKMKEINYKIMSYMVLMSILIFYRLCFYLIIEISILLTSPEEVERISYDPTEILIPSYVSEILIEVFILFHMFFQGNNQRLEKLGIKKFTQLEEETAIYPVIREPETSQRNLYKSREMSSEYLDLL